MGFENRYKRMKAKIKDKLTKDLLKRLYLRDNLSLIEIANLFDASVPYVGYLKEQYGIKTKPSIAYRGKHFGHSISHPRPPISHILTKDALEKMYLMENKSLEDIAIIYKCSRAGVHWLFKKYNIRPRNLSMARDLALKAGKLPYNNYSINKDYFSQWSRGMAYILGLLVAKGRLVKTGTKRYMLQIVQSDLEMINKFKEMVKSTHPTARKKHNAFNKVLIFYQININVKTLIKDLLKLGYRGNRRNMVNILHAIPRGYVFDYLRGYFEGRGLISIGKRIIIGISSPNKRYLLDVCKIFKRYDLKSNVAKYGNGYAIYFKDRVKIYKAYKILYSNCGNAFLNSRRKLLVNALIKLGIDI